MVPVLILGQRVSVHRKFFSGDFLPLLAENMFQFLFFRPDLIGEEYEGLHEVLVYSIQKSDMDLRKVLFQNIVLSGGSTLFKGFGDRLLSEVKKLAPKDIKIRISAPQERLYSTWIGGSILASLDTFKKMWVSKREYDEEGLRAIHRKTF